jgi:hypothetical protein
MELRGRTSLGVRWWLLTAAGLLGVALSGCTTGHAPVSLRLRTSYGQDSLSLAAHVPGCVAPVRVALPVGPPNSVASTCLIGQHRVVIYTWRDAASERLATRLLSTGAAAYSAIGIGWTAVLGDQAELGTHLAVLSPVAAALSGDVVLSGPSSAATT